MRNIILKYGIIFGVISSIAGALFLRGAIGMGISSLISYAGILLVLVIAGLEYRKSQEGFASFGELLKLFLGIILIFPFFFLLSMIPAGILKKN